MCFGTFDVLHLGHLSYFEQAKKYEDYLIVVIARDYTRQQQKKETIFSEVERQKLVQSLKVVDEAVLGNPDDHLKIIRERKPTVICLGYDQNITETELAAKLAQDGLFPQILRAKPYHLHQQKSSRVKKLILGCS